MPMSFWSAPTEFQNKRSVKVGLNWTESFLICVNKAATVGFDELEKLRLAEVRLADMGGTTQSAMATAVRFAIKSPVFTVASLANEIVITPQAASVLVRQMVGN